MDLLEKAKRDYPIGTKFKSVFTEDQYTSTGNYIMDDDDVFIKNKEGWWWCIYYSKRNQWAEIIKEETMFKKGDYIVTLINDGDCGKVNYCSKQTIDNEYLRPEFDTKGCTDNGNSTFIFSDKSGWKWRFATKEEGEEYEKHGKPYNVTNIVKNNMTQQEFNSLRVGDFISNYEILHKFKEFLIVLCNDGHDLFDLEKINKLGLKVTPKTFMGLEIKEYDNVPCEIDGCLLVYLIEVKDNCIFYKPSRNFKPDQITPTSIKLL